MNKLKSRAAFTFVELLACAVILLLICLICSAGFRLAVKEYNRSLFLSNSQMLEATLQSVMGDVFRYAYGASTVSAEDTQVESFYSSNYSTLGRVQLKIEDGQLILYNAYETEYLVSKNTYAENLRIRDGSLVVRFDSAEDIFSGEYVIESTVVQGLEKKVNFQFRTITDK